MKISKVIEVEVCDNCQAEQHSPSDVRECSSCKKVMCYRCAEVVFFRVVHSVPMSCIHTQPQWDARLDGMYGLNCKETEFEGHICVDCALHVIEAIKQFGIVAPAASTYLLKGGCSG